VIKIIAVSNGNNPAGQEPEIIIDRSKMTIEALQDFLMSHPSCSAITDYFVLDESTTLGKLISALLEIGDANEAVINPVEEELQKFLTQIFRFKRAKPE
jgi:hypothetical protein